MVTFKKIHGTEQDVKVLYDLLSKRRYSISHGAMPNIASHRSFVRDNPYREWFLVKHDKAYIGSFYLTHENHISISLLPKYYDKFRDVLTWIMKTFPVLPEVKSVRPPSYQMNVPIADYELLNILDQIGFKKIQVTYTLETPNE